MKLFGRMTPTKVIIIGYLVIILAGTILLSLPIATRSGTPAPLFDAIFTATSATCVTGLVVVDTYSFWAPFGQLVILLLIQVGGMGFITMAIAIVRFTHVKIGLKQRLILQESIAAPKVGGIVRLAGFIFKFVIAMELIGFIVIATRFCPQFGFFRGLYFSLFHSISSFCNAGFDLLGYVSPGSSLTSFSGDVVVNTVTMILTIVGGIGFFVWDDIRNNKFNFRHYALQTKLVLTATAVLIIVPTIAIMFIESGNFSLENMSGPARIMAILFQSITTRTAGFNTLDLTQLAHATLLIFVLLMMIGGSPGSTAGGMKTTTFAVMLLCVRSYFRKQESISVFKRRLNDEILRRACIIFVLYLILTFLATIMISAIDGFPIMESLFESASAIGTVGLSLGITPQLSAIPRIMVILLMYFGRVGCLTFLYAMMKPSVAVPYKLPLDNIAVG